MKRIAFILLWVTVNNIQAANRLEYIESQSQRIFLADVAPNGIIVGSQGSNDKRVQAFWYENGVFHLLPIIQSKSSAAIGISRDGKTIGGYYSNDRGLFPFFYNIETARMDISRHSANMIEAMSDNGQRIIGYNKGTASIYEPNNIVIALEKPAYYTSSFIQSITTDGGMGVGYVMNSDSKQGNRFIACSWVNEKCRIFKELIFPFDCVSGDGSVIAGRKTIEGEENELYIYENNHINKLGFDGHGLRMNYNGKYLVGTMPSNNKGEGCVGFIWDKNHGKRNLEELVAINGIDLKGRHLTEPVGIAETDTSVLIVGNEYLDEFAWERSGWLIELSKRTID